MRTPILFGTLALALSLTACGDDTGGTGTGSGSGGGSSSTGDTAASTTDAASSGTGTASVTSVDCASVTPDAEITTEGFAFSPTTATVPAGGTIRFTPAATTHNIAGTDGSWSSEFGATVCFQFATAGSFAFQCDAHASQMTGTITVQ
jgi:plastocyanin